IARDMIDRNELSRECIVQGKGDPRRMLELIPMDIGVYESSHVKAYQAQTKQLTPCCPGAHCAVSVYKRNDYDDNFSRVLGPIYSDMIMIIAPKPVNGLSR